MKLFTARRASMLAAAALGIALLAGCSAGAPTRDEATDEITEAGDADVFQIKLGDCLDDSGASEVSEVPVVPCDQPHDLEVFHVFEMPAGEWPGDAAVQAATEAGCLPAFETFVGMPFQDSVLDLLPYTPLEEGWTGLDDREIICMVADPGVQTTGTLAGAAR